MSGSAPLVFRCPSCGGINRVPAARLAEGPRCGRCHVSLASPVTPVEVDDAELERLIAKSPIPVLVDFWAPWCGPCRAVAPHLERLAARLGGRLIVAKVNTDQHQRTAARLGVQAIPTLALWHGGSLVARQAGALMGQQLHAFVAPHLRAA